MAEKTLILSEDVVEQLEDLARERGRTVEALLAEWLATQKPPTQASNWAARVARSMAEADIDWAEPSELSSTSRDAYGEAVYQRWLRTQQEEDEKDASDG